MLERVQKIIANNGFCSRRKAEDLIEKGKVKVNNKRITIGDKADPDKDMITIEDAADDIAKPCVCGIVNRERAREVFDRLSSK